MAKIEVPDHMKEQRTEPEIQPELCGPFVTISRQFGCQGFSLGLLLLDILNEEVEPPHAWRIYHKEVLSRLAVETNMAAEVLDRERRSKPRFIVDFFRSLGGEKVPSGIEIRNRINTIIRGLAVQGYAIIIGQGSSGACQDLPNGLSIRLKAPEDWRVKQVAFREGLTATQARLRVQAMEQEREYLRKIYETKFPRRPAFNLVYDTSAFSLTQIAQHVVYAMRLKKIITRAAAPGGSLPNDTVTPSL